MAVCKEYAADIVRNFAKDGELRDITLVAGIGGQRFPVHRIILSVSSEYFRDLCRARLNDNEIIIKDMGGPMLKEIIDFCYTGRIELTEENVDDILAAATSLELSRLERRCYKFWKMNSFGNRLVFTLMRADKFNLEHLRKRAMDAICEKFENVPVAELQQLDEHLFREMLSSCRIVAREIVIFDRITHWVDENEIDRAKYVPNLLKHIEFDQIPLKILREKVDPFCGKYGCTELLPDEYRKRSGAVSPAYEKSYIYCVSLNSHGLTYHKFGFKTKTWTTSLTITSPVIQRSVFYGDRVITFEREDGKIKTIRSMDVKSYQATLLPTLPNAATNVQPIVIDGRLYVFSKNCDSNEQISCQRFNSEEGTWESLSESPETAEYVHSAVELFGCVYYAWKPISREKLGKMLRYDTQTDTWSEKAGILNGWPINFFKSEYSLYATVFFLPFSYALYSYDIDADAWNWVRDHGQIEIYMTVEFEGETYANTSRGFGIISPEKVNFFNEICDVVLGEGTPDLCVAQNLICQNVQYPVQVEK